MEIRPETNPTGKDKDSFSIKYIGIIDGHMGILSRRQYLEPYQPVQDKLKRPMPTYYNRFRKQCIETLKDAREQQLRVEGHEEQKAHTNSQGHPHVLSTHQHPNTLNSVNSTNPPKNNKMNKSVEHEHGIAKECGASRVIERQSPVPMSTVTSFYDSGGQQQPPRRGLPPTGGSEGRVLAFIKCPSPLRMESRNLKNLLNTSSKKLSPRARRVGAVVVGHGPVEGGQSYYVHPRTPLREREGGSVTLRGKVGSTNTNTNTNNTGGGETEAKNNIGNRGNSTGSRVFPQVFREGGGAKNNIGTKNRGQSIGNKGGVSGGSGGSGNSKGIDKFYERHETEFRGEGKGEEVSTGRKDQHIAHPHAPKFAYGKPTLLNMLVSPLQIQRVSHNSQNPHNPPHDPPPNPPHKKNAKRAANPNREPPEPRGKKMSSNRGEVSKSLPPTYPGDIYSHHIFAQPHLPYTPIVQRPGDQLPNSHSFLVGAPEYFTHHQLGPHRSETQTQNVSSETGNFRTLPAHGVSSSDAATSQAISQIGCMPPMHIMSNENIPERREETIGEVEEETGPVQRTGVYHCYAASSGSGISGMAGYSIPSIHSQGVGTGSSLQVGSPLDKHRGVVAQGKGIVGAVGAVGGVGAVRRSSDNCIPPRGHDNYNYVPQGQSPKSIEREGQITNTTRTQKSRQQHPTKVVSYGGSVGNSPDKEEDMEIPMQMNVNISKTPNQQMEGVTLDDVSPPIDTQGPPPPLEKETGIPAPQKYDQYLVHNYIKGHGLKGSHRDKAPKPQNPLPPGTPEKKTYDLDTLCKPMSRGLAGQKITTRLFLASAVRGQIRNQHEHRNSNPPNFLELNQKISQGAGPETQESFSVTPQLGRTGLMTTGGSNMNMGSTDKGSISNIKNQNHIKTESSPHRKWEQLHQDLISKHSQRKTLESAGVQGSSISRRGSTLTTDTTYKFPYSNRPNYTKVTTKKLELNLPYPPGKGLQGMPMSLRMSGILNQTVYGGEELRGGLVLLPRGMETDGQWGSDPLNSIGTPRVAPNQLSFTGASKYHHHTPNRGETAHSQRDSKKDTIIHVGSVKLSSNLKVQVGRSRTQGTQEGGIGFTNEHIMKSFEKDLGVAGDPDGEEESKQEKETKEMEVQVKSADGPDEEEDDEDEEESIEQKFIL